MRALPLIAAAGALGITAAAPALGAWGEPERVSTGAGDAHSPDLAMNGRGDAVAAWVQEDDGRGTIVATARRAGGTWSPPRRVSPPGLAAIDPAVALTPGGSGIVVWRQVDRHRVLRGRRQAVYVARARERTAPGIWGPVRRLSDRRQKVGEPQVAADGRGTAVATWHWGTGTPAGTPGHIGQVQVSEKPLGRGWTRARRASSPGGCALDTRLPRVAAGPGGQAVVWWQCDLSGGRSGARAIGRGPSPAAWSSERPLPFGARGDQASDLGVRPDGTVLAASAPGRSPALWRGAAPLGTPGGLLLRRLAPPLAAQAAADRGSPSAAGGAVAGWIEPGGLALADIGAAGEVDRISSPAGPPAARRDVRVAAAPGGSAVAVALSGTGVVATSRPAGGDWAALERISAAGAAQDARVAASDGVAAAYWSRRSGRRRAVERAELSLRPAP